MEKLTANDPQTHSADVVVENVGHLQALFPEAFSEGKVDFEVLKQLLGGATVIFCDGAFADDIAKTNLVAILEQHGLGNVRSL